MADPTQPDATPAPDLGDAAGRLVARVRAWQQRHPLARRIGVNEVVGLGVVGLPYGPAAEGKSEPLFHQPNLLPGLSHRALLQFAEQHAVRYRPGPDGWPLREIERSDASEEAAPETRYLLTAAINDAHPRRALPHRLLIAPESPAIWGRRQWSRERLVAAALLLVAGLAVAAMGSRLLWRAPTAAVAPAPLASASAAASAAPSAPTPSAVKVAVPASAPVPIAAPSAASSAAVARPVAASAPAIIAATVPVPSTAMPASAASAAATAVPPPRLLPMPHQATAAAAPVASAGASAALPTPLTTGTHYALVTAPAKKREVAEATLERVRKLLGPAIGTLQAQVMQSPEGFVVTIWPLPTEPDAQRLAEVLARRGVPMKWLEF